MWSIQSLKLTHRTHGKTPQDLEKTPSRVNSPIFPGGLSGGSSKEAGHLRAFSRVRMVVGSGCWLFAQGASHILQGAWCMEKHGCYRTLVEKCEAKGNRLNLEFMKQIATPPHKKTVRPWKWMVGRRDLPFWETPIFRGVCCKSWSSTGKTSEVCGKRNLHVFFHLFSAQLSAFAAVNLLGGCKVYPPPRSLTASLPLKSYLQH